LVCGGCMAIVVGIDIGTQSTKAICYDTDLKQIAASAQAPHALNSRDDGTREQLASWWIDAIAACFKNLPDWIKSQSVAIGVSGQQHGFVPVDAHGNVLYPVKLWNDTSTAPECDELTALCGGSSALLGQEGNLILPGYTASKILWFRKNHRDLYDRMAKILLPHDYVNYFLTGAYTMEYGDASGTGLLDIRTRTWSTRLLRALDSERDLADALPGLIEAHQCAGTLKTDTARLLGLPSGIVVSSGGGDNMMGAIGTGTVSDGTLTMSLGTSGTLFGASGKPIIDPKGRLAAFCSSTGAWLPLLCTMNCTVASEVSRSLFKKGVKEFDACAMSAPIGCEGVVMLPYFNGERTPNYPKGKGCLMGFTLENMTEANISRSAMESAIFGLKSGLEAFQELGFSARGIRLIGGGAKSPLWRQMVADVCDLPVSIPSITEAAALGAALQGWWAYCQSKGQEISIEKIVQDHVQLDSGATCLPEAQSVSLYRQAYDRYLTYATAVRPLFS